MEITSLIHQLISNKKLENEDLERAMQIISLGGATPAQISAFFTGILIRKTMKDNVQGLIKYIEIKNENLSNTKIFTPDNLYLFSSDILPITFILAIIISELKRLTVVRFQSNSRDENDITKILKINLDIDNDLELKMLKNHGVSLVKNRYESVFKNLFFLSRELKFKGLIETLESLVSPKDYYKKIIILKEGELLLDILTNVKCEKLFVIIYSEKRKTLEIINNSKSIFNFELNDTNIFYDISCIDKLSENKVVSNLLTDVINKLKVFDKKITKKQITTILTSKVILNKLEKIIKLSSSDLK